MELLADPPAVYEGANHFYDKYNREKSTAKNITQTWTMAATIFLAVGVRTKNEIYLIWKQFSQRSYWLIIPLRTKLLEDSMTNTREQMEIAQNIKQR